MAAPLHPPRSLDRQFGIHAITVDDAKRFLRRHRLVPKPCAGEFAMGLNWIGIEVGVALIEHASDADGVALVRHVGVAPMDTDSRTTEARDFLVARIGEAAAALGYRSLVVAPDAQRHAPVEEGTDV